MQDRGNERSYELKISNLQKALKSFGRAYNTFLTFWNQSLTGTSNESQFSTVRSWQRNDLGTRNLACAESIEIPDKGKDIFTYFEF